MQESFRSNTSTISGKIQLKVISQDGDQIQLSVVPTKTILELQKDVIKKMLKSEDQTVIDQYKLYDKDNFAYDEEEIVEELIENDEEIQLAKYKKSIPKPEESIPINKVVPPANNQPIIPQVIPVVPSLDQNLVQQNSNSSNNEELKQLILDFQSSFELQPKVKFESLLVNEEFKFSQDEIVVSINYPQINSLQNTKKYVFRKKMSLMEMQAEVKKEFLDLSGTSRAFIYNDIGIHLRNPDFYILTQIEDVIENKDNVFVIFTESEVHINKVLAPVDHQDPNDQDQIFLKTDKTSTLNVNLDLETVGKLRQKASNLLQYPSNMIRMTYGSKILNNDAVLLKDYAISRNSTVFIDFTTRETQTYGLRGSRVKHLVTQKEEGIRAFRSHLYVMSNDQSLNDETINKFLGVMRDFSNNNVPFISALRCLFSRLKMNSSQNVAIEQGMLSVFAKVVTSNEEQFQKLVDNKIDVTKLFNYSRAILCALISFAQTINPIPQAWTEREKYKSFDRYCNVTYMEVDVPALLKKDNGTEVLVDKNQILAMKLENKIIPGIAEFQPEMLRDDPQTTQLLYLSKIGSIMNHSQIWNPVNFEFQPLKKIENLALKQDWVASNQLIWNNSTTYQIFPPASLMNQNIYPVLTQRQSKLVIYNSQTKNNELIIIDIINDTEENLKITDLDSKAVVNNTVNQSMQRGMTTLQEKLSRNLPPVITIDPEQAIVVLLDTSGSMEESFNGLTLQRMGATKSFFAAFADRTIAYGLKHVISLIFFDHNITVVTDFTQMFVQFKEHVNLAEPTGGTSLFDALDKGVELLNKLMLKYPRVIPRIIALTDGEDRNSTQKPLDVIKNIKDSNIIIDSFVVGSQCNDLKNITFESGGKCYFPQSLEQGIKLFEFETILSASLREKEIKQDSQSNVVSSSNFSSEAPQMILPKAVNLPSTNPQILIDNPQQIPDSSVNTRIMKELSGLFQNPHPNLKVFPALDDITFWKIVLFGPEDTPYYQGVFTLYLQFPIQYPNKAPKIRFLTPIYHCNINQSGRICHQVLDDGYTRDTTCQVIFDCLFGLLLSPQPEDPLDSALATEYLSEKEQYNKKALDHTVQFAQRPFDAIVQDIFSTTIDKIEKSVLDDLLQWITSLSEKKI